MNKTTLANGLLAMAALGLSSLSLAAATAPSDDSPYNLSTTPASTAWQATPIVNDAPAAPAAKAAPVGDQRVRPIGSVSGKSRGSGKNVGGEAIVTLNNDTPEGNVQLFGEVKGGVSATRTR